VKDRIQASAGKPRAAETAVTDTEAPRRAGTSEGAGGEDLRDASVAQPRWQILLITAAAATAEVLMVAGGYAVGTRPHAELLQKLVLWCGLAIVIVSVFLPQPRATRSVSRQCAVYLCVYVFLMEIEPSWIFSLSEPLSFLLVILLFLVPVVMAGLILPRRGSWLGGMGFWLVLFSAVAWMAYDATHRRGIGFLFVSTVIVN
jgi:hypothetical protein